MEKFAVWVDQGTGKVTPKGCDIRLRSRLRRQRRVKAKDVASGLFVLITLQDDELRISSRR